MKLVHHPTWCVRSCVLTESTNNFEQKKQTHRRTFIIFVTKPTWKTGFASSMCPKWPGHSVMLPKWRIKNRRRQLAITCWLTHKMTMSCGVPAHVWHLPLLSITPCLGSMRPPSFGRPPSVVSGYLIPPSVTDIRFWRKTADVQVNCKFK